MADEVNEAKKSLTELSSILAVVDKQTAGFAKSIANASNESKAWTMVSRVLSGSGLWKLQNKLRAVAQAFDFYAKAQERAMKAQAEYVEDLAKLQEASAGVEDQLSMLNAIRDKGVDGLSKEQKNNTAIINQYKLLAEDIRTAREEMGLSTDAKLIDKLTTERLGASYETLKIKLQKLGKERVKQLKKSMSKEAKTEIQERLKKNKQIMSNIKQFDKEIKIVKKKMNSGALITLEESGEWKTKEDYNKEYKSLIGKKGAAVSGIGGVKGVKDKIAEQKKLLKGPLRKTIEGSFKAMKMVTLIPLFKKLKEIGFKKVLGNVWVVMKMALKYSMYFMLFIMAAFLIFEIIKQIGGTGDLMGTVVTAIKEIMSGLFMVVEGFMLIFSAFFGGGTFGERLMLLVTGFGKIFGGLGTILWAVLKGVLKFAIGIIVGVAALYFKIILKFMRFIFDGKFREELVDKIKKFVSNWWDKKIGTWDDIKKKIGTFWTDKVWGPFLAWGNKMLTRFKDAVNPFAAGGTVVGGLSLVGERGPELVKLPRGSRVHSNKDSRNMLANSGNLTNNVSVNVSGRVGASDSELRDIAKKIGRMVNEEINRTTSSSTNMRF